MTFARTAFGGRPPAHRSPWFTIEGALLIVLGAAALILPVAAGLAAALVLGWVLILGGVVGLLSLFAGRHTHPIWTAVAAIVSLLVGLLLIASPLAGTAFLATLIALYLIIDGASLLFAAAHHQRGDGGRWAWLAALGVLDVVVGVAILFAGPLATTVLVGFIVGIDLILGGLTLIGVGRSGPIGLRSA